MPVLNTYEKPAGQVRFGYIDGKKIVRVKPARVNVTFTFEDGETATFRKETVIVVALSEHTDEELQEMGRKQIIARLNGFCHDARQSWDDFEKRREQRLEDGWGRLDHWLLDDQLTAAADYDLAMTIETWFEKDPENRSEWDTAVMLIKSFAQTVLYAAMNRRVLSRSTSITSNLCEDLEIAAKGRLLEKLRWDSTYLPELQIGVFDR